MKSFQQDFALVGISVDDLRGKSPGQLFDLFAAKISQIKDPTDRTAAAVRIFGDDVGRRLLPLLIEGRKGLKKYADQAREVGAVQSDEMVQSGAQAAKSFRKLHEVISAQFTRAVANNAKELESLAGNLIDLGKGVVKYGSKITGFFTELGKELGSPSGPTSAAASAAKLRGELNGLVQDQLAASQQLNKLTARHKTADEKAVKDILGRQMQSMLGEIERRQNRIATLRRQLETIAARGPRADATGTGGAGGGGAATPGAQANFDAMRSAGIAAGQRGGGGGPGDHGPHADPSKNPVVIERKRTAAYIERVQARHVDRMTALTQSQTKSEVSLAKTAGKAMESINAGTLDRIANAAQGQNKKIFKITKVARIAQATTDSYRAFNAALANPPGPPFSIPQAGAALALGLAQVARISKTSFSGGGGSGGGAGGGGKGSTTGTVPNPIRSPQPIQPTAQAQAKPTKVDITVHHRGNTWSNDEVAQMAKQLGEHLNDGGELGSFQIVREP